VQKTYLKSTRSCAQIELFCKRDPVSTGSPSISIKYMKYTRSFAPSIVILGLFCKRDPVLTGSHSILKTYMRYTRSFAPGIVILGLFCSVVILGLFCSVVILGLFCKRALFLGLFCKRALSVQKTYLKYSRSCAQIELLLQKRPIIKLLLQILGLPTTSKNRALLQK